MNAANLQNITKSINLILPFGIIWLVFGWLFLFIEMAATDGFNHVAAGAVDMSLPVFIFASTGILFFGILMGFIEVFYIGKLFASKSLGKKLAFKSLLYVASFLVIVVASYPIAASIELKVGVLDAKVWQKFASFLITWTFLSTMLQLSVSLIISLFYSEISGHIGHKVLLQLLRGKYHQPLEERRIFMFLDMNDSTGIAERLGHHRYFSLLKNYFRDMSSAIQKFDGEIYQYVGDEIVISWKQATLTSSAPVLSCFFEMRSALQNRKDFYLKKFGVQPTFEAGIHCGPVTAGEIGVLKKEIIFTGDTLNATARILGLAKNTKANLVISGFIAESLPKGDNYVLNNLGAVELRGKKELLTVFAVAQT
ncbi:MAG: adenylate/guanylate cyclase domain-containing protein [Leeuwenhoekiella sp.]